ncbi:MAG TPA: hypothetical protein VFC50_03025 [Candidatus Dormibacteraeota bacterium]|nr:hypothetical protein [Candidatus Dormibacteraeota bacterium]
MKPLARKHIWKFASLAAADGIVFGFTNTASVPSFVLMAGFLLLSVTFYYLIRGLLTFVGLYGVSVRRKRRLAAVMTGSVSGLVALQSIGELNSRDVLVLVPLMLIAYVYTSYGKSTRRLGDAKASEYAASALG